MERIIRDINVMAGDVVDFIIDYGIDGLAFDDLGDAGVESQTVVSRARVPQLAWSPG